MIPPKENVRYISLETFKQEHARTDTIVIDVRPPESFQEEHLPDAVNFCVYEVSFADKVLEKIHDKHEPIVVYGESPGYWAAEVAFDRLTKAGYDNVHVLEGGLAEWASRSGKLKTNGIATHLELPSGKLSLDSDKSQVLWTGRNLTNCHYGKIAVKSGWIELQHGDLTGGELVVDMKEITCDDLTDGDMNKGLINHLSNSDFFKVDEFPEARFRVKASEAISENSYGQPNLHVEGEMTIRGVTRPMHFRGMLNPIEGGASFQAQLELNRVPFGAVYGSGSLFERLGMHLVNDLVSLQVIALFKK